MNRSFPSRNTKYILQPFFSTIVQKNIWCTDIQYILHVFDFFFQRAEVVDLSITVSVFSNRQYSNSVFKEKGVDLSSQLVASCYIGMTACSLALAAAVCGNPNVPVYYVSVN